MRSIGNIKKFISGDVCKILALITLAVAVDVDVVVVVVVVVKSGLLQSIMRPSQHANEAHQSADSALLSL